MKSRPPKKDYTIYKDEIKNCIEVLKKGGIILYPTDTIWGIGCDATNADAINKIIQLKQRNEEKSMLILVNSEVMLEQYVKEIPEAALLFLESYETPLTIVYPNPINLPDNLINNDGTVGIRITKDDFCSQLLYNFRRPIVSTSANVSGQPAPLNFNKITPDILNNVDYVVNLRQHETAQSKPSTIIKVETNGVFKYLRK